MMRETRFSYNDKGESVIHTSVAAYMQDPNKFLHDADHLKVSGTVYGGDLSGFFESKSRLMPSRVKTIDISDLHTDIPISSTAEMFKGNRHLTEIVGIEELGKGRKGVERVGDMREMFAGCESLTYLGLGGWDPGMGLSEGVGTMQGMFKDCTSLEHVTFTRSENDQVVSGWKGADNMAQMFQGCKLLDSLEVSTFEKLKKTDPDKVYDFAAGCDKLERVTLPVMAHHTDDELFHPGVRRETMFHGDNKLAYLSGGNLSIQEDQRQFVQGYARNELGYSYDQSKVWSKVIDSEIQTIEVVRREEIEAYMDRREKQWQNEHGYLSERIHGTEGKSRGDMADQMFGHIQEAQQSEDELQQ